MIDLNTEKMKAFVLALMSLDPGMTTGAMFLVEKVYSTDAELSEAEIADLCRDTALALVNELDDSQEGKKVLHVLDAWMQEKINAEMAKVYDKAASPSKLIN